MSKKRKLSEKNNDSIIIVKADGKSYHLTNSVMKIVFSYLKKGKQFLEIGLVNKSWLDVVSESFDKVIFINSRNLYNIPGKILNFAMFIGLEIDSKWKKKNFIHLEQNLLSVKKISFVYPTTEKILKKILWFKNLLPKVSRVVFLDGFRHSIEKASPFFVKNQMKIKEISGISFQHFLKSKQQLILCRELEKLHFKEVFVVNPKKKRTQRRVFYKSVPLVNNNFIKRLAENINPNLRTFKIDFNAFGSREKCLSVNLRDFKSRNNTFFNNIVKLQVPLLVDGVLKFEKNTLIGNGLFKSDRGINANLNLDKLRKLIFDIQFLLPLGKNFF